MPYFTVPKSEPPEYLAPNNKFTGILLYPSVDLPKEFFTLAIPGGGEIQFYSLYPLYQEEMELKISEGLESLLDKFQYFNTPNMVSLKRRNTCRKRRFNWF